MAEGGEGGSNGSSECAVSAHVQRCNNNATVRLKRELDGSFSESTHITRMLEVGCA